MQTSNNIHESWSQRIVILALLGVLSIAAAYVWGTRLSAGSDRSVAQAPQYATLRGVAGARALDTAALRAFVPAESRNARLSGVAAVRAADVAAPVPLTGLRGVAAVRSIDADQGR